MVNFLVKNGESVKKFYVADNGDKVIHTAIREISKSIKNINK